MVAGSLLAPVFFWLPSFLFLLRWSTPAVVFFSTVQQIHRLEHVAQAFPLADVQPAAAVYSDFAVARCDMVEEDDTERETKKERMKIE